MKKHVIIYSIVALIAIIHNASAAGSSNSAFYVPDVRTDVTDIESIKRGAETFFSNCVACHSTKYMRYQRISDDLSITEEEMRDKGMLPPNAKIVDSVLTQLPADAAQATYGIVPPDLSLKAREKGTAWLHKFLTHYYEDSNSKTGFNNAFFPGTAMPNQLAGKQGILSPVYETLTANNGTEVKKLVGVAQKSKGSLSKKEFYVVMRDLVTYLEYVAEPSKIERLSLGYIVILFLLGLFGLCYLLKRELWKEVD